MNKWSLFFLILGACGAAHQKPVTDYDQSCTSSADCVIESEACMSCCHYVSINKSAQATYEADRATEQKSCSIPVCTSFCVNVIADCQAGKCAVIAAPAPTGS